MQTTMGYAYDSHLSYLDHLRLADAARKGGEAAGDAAERGARRVAGAVDGLSSEVRAAAEGADRNAERLEAAVSEVSSEVRAARQVMEWGFSSMLNGMAEMKTTLEALLQCARNPSQTWAYEQFEIARSNARKGNFEECLKRLDYAIDGYQTQLGYPEGWQFHQLRGDIYLQCLDRSLINEPKAEKCFLAAAKYADTPDERMMALTAAAVAAYNQGHMEVAENYATEACSCDPKVRGRYLAEANFQLARIRLNRQNTKGAWQAARMAIELDHRYAARLPRDSEVIRNAKDFKPLWIQYAKEIRGPLTATSNSATAALQELAKSREEIRERTNVRTIRLLESPALAPAKARFQQMTDLVNKLSPQAEQSLKLLAESVRGNSVYSFLEAEPLGQQTNDLATRALAASREAELTLRKVEQLSQGLPIAEQPPVPQSPPLAFFFALLYAGGTFFVGGILLFGCLGNMIRFFVAASTHGKDIYSETYLGWIFLILILAGGVAVGWEGFKIGKKQAGNKIIESFEREEINRIDSWDWSAANRPQTDTVADGNLRRENHASMAKSEGIQDVLDGFQALYDEAENISVGRVYTGTVVDLKEFGAFIELPTGQKGICHISEISDTYVNNVEDVLKIGDTVKVKVIQIDPQGLIKLSCKAVL